MILSEKLDAVRFELDVRTLGVWTDTFQNYNRRTYFSVDTQQRNLIEIRRVYLHVIHCNCD